ncbi:hypothetical protein ACJX0J_029890, partial [Zea mays]
GWLSVDMRISHLIALRVYAVLLMPGFIEGQQIKSVVAFVTGGAWIIGNFPRGTISDVVSDGSEAISFICNNVVSFVGDPTKIYLMGQSAGAHIRAPIYVFVYLEGKNLKAWGSVLLCLSLNFAFYNNSNKILLPLMLLFFSRYEWDRMILGSLNKSLYLVIEEPGGLGLFFTMF